MWTILYFISMVSCSAAGLSVLCLLLILGLYDGECFAVFIVVVALLSFIWWICFD